LADLGALTRLARTLGDNASLARVAVRQTRYHLVVGEYDATARSALHAIELAQAAEDLGLQADAYYQWGVALWHQGNLAEAVEETTKGLELARQAGLAHLESECLHNLGIIRFYQGDAEHGAELTEQALAICRRTGDRRGMGGPLNTLAGMAATRGDYLASRAALTEALEIAREIGDRRMEATLLSNMGELSTLCGDVVAAEGQLEAALAIYPETEDRRGTGDTLVKLAQVAILRGEYETALDLATRSLAVGREIQHPLMQSSAQLHLGHAHAGLRQWERAAEHYAAARQRFEDLGQEAMATEAVAGLAQVARGEDPLSQALALVEAILPRVEAGQLAGACQPMRVYLTCYEVLQAADDPRAAAVLARACAELDAQAERLSDPAARRLFREAIPANRAIAALCATDD
jgi:tetratricopeptide (TPR) repeat protein